MDELLNETDALFNINAFQQTCTSKPYTTQLTPTATPRFIVVVN